MSQTLKTPTPQPLNIRLAGFSAVILAIGLSAVGTILAFQQVRLLTVRLMTETSLRAGQIAAQATEKFQQRVNAALLGVASHRRDHGGVPWARTDAFPSWLDGVYLWDGFDLEVLAPAASANSELSGLVRSRLIARSAPVDGIGVTGRAEVIYGERAGQTVVIATIRAYGGDLRPLDVAAIVDTDRVASELIKPLLATDDALELVRVADSDAPGAWDQRLSGALHFWAIRPAETFVREQRRTVFTQTLVYVVLTTLALATVLIAMLFLTRLVRREVALAEMKANFVADVSHELKTPLALIHMFAETLQSGRVTSDEKRNEYYEIITRESTRLTNLIDNILDFARIEAGRKEYSFSKTDVAAVVKETYEAYRPQLDHAGFEHHLTIATGLPLVDADRDAISQVVVNLITNAIKYSPDERHLVIDLQGDTRRGRRGILLSVHDRGIGVRPEERALLTEGFYRARDSRVRQQGGTGLGLALVKQIVEVHGGTLDVESRLVKGSTFRVFLPASSADSEAPATTDVEDSQLQRDQT